MYKVMIVDDEILVRVGLKSTIDWESIGFTIAAEASNGEQALEVYRAQRPDVILTDIRMPKKDGLWLTETIKKEDPWVKILILTCYDDFSYVREALKHGATDYILKSEIEDEELVKVMEEVRASLDAEAIKQKKYTYIQHQINSNITELKEKLLDNLIKSKVKIDDELRAKCQELSFDIEGKEFLLATLYRDDLERNQSFSDKDWQLMNFAIVNIAGEIFNESSLGFLAGLNDNNFVILISKDKINETEIMPVFRRLKNSVSQYLNIPLSIVIGDKFSDLSRAGVMFEMCAKKSQFIFYSDESCIIDTHQKEFKEIFAIEIKKRYEDAMINSLDEENIEKALEAVDEMERFFKQSFINPLQVRLFYSNMMSDVLEHYTSAFSITDELEDYTQYYNLIMKAVKIKDLSGLFKEFLQKITKFIENYRVNNSNSIIQKSIEFINKNYSGEISLQALASHLNLSKHYVCFLFKKETGENISVYINKVRIEKAKQLLKKSDYKAKEIYDQVGFSDQQYFSKIFKKVTGMTVAQYRDGLSKKDAIK
ncbi:MAG: response regulator [Clostridia bacterium]|nr:response regulator [Clostridia bacterium]